MSLTLVRRPDPERLGVALLPVDEGRAGQHARHCRTNPGVEVAAVFPLARVERHRRFGVLSRDRPTERPARQGRDDLLCAHRLVRGGRGAAHEDALAAGRVADPGRVVRPFDHASADAGVAARHVHFLRVAQGGLPVVLLLRRLVQPGEGDVVRASRHGDTDLQALVDDFRGLVHIGDAHLVVVGTADFFGEHLFAVHEDDVVLRLFVALDSGISVRMVRLRRTDSR